MLQPMQGLNRPSKARIRPRAAIAQGKSATAPVKGLSSEQFASLNWPARATGELCAIRTFVKKK
jgi:hypothetical protein